MSYHLTISRATGGPVTEASALKALPTVEGFAVKTQQGEYLVFTFRLEGHPDLYVYWRNGQLWAERADDDAHVPILVKIASLLDAQLVGDEGEVYSSEGVSRAKEQPRTASTYLRDVFRRYRVSIVILSLFALAAWLTGRYG